MIQIVCKAGLSLLVILMMMAGAAAQVSVGDDVSLNATGNVSFGYSGSYGNQIESSHGLSAGGSGTVSGYYYDPNFLNFNISPYYNESRANSSYQSTSAASGFNSSADIFSGSYLPGSVNYSTSFNSDGNFGIPGYPSYTTHGNNRTFGVSWSELFPDVPSLTVSYQTGSNDYSIYGSDRDGSSGFRGIMLRSAYTLEGFKLNGFYGNSTSHSLTPDVLGAQQTESSQADSNVFGFSASHTLPLKGQFTAGFTRSDVHSDFADYGFDGTIDSLTGAATMQPTNKLHLNMSISYSDNFAGTLYQSLLPTTGGGGVVSSGSAYLVGLPASNQTSNSTDILGSASYTFLPNLSGQAYIDRRMQNFLGESYGSTVYGGGISYARPLLGGNLSTSLTAQDSTTDGSSTNALGFTASAGYSRRFNEWRVSGNIVYAQDVDTLLITEMTSYYTLSANATRRFGALTTSFGVSFSRSALSQNAGTTNESKSYSAGLGYKNWVSLNGSYAQSSGNGLLTPGGVVNASLPELLPPELLLMYGGRNYSVGLSSTPIRKLTLGAAFSRASSDTTSAGVGSWNKTETRNALLQYQFRKMYLNAGYSRIMQSFSASGLPPGVANSFYFGVGRWFNFF